MVGVTVSPPVANQVNGRSFRLAPPMLKKKVPRMPPISPIGVSIASMRGKRSSALKNAALWPMNSRYS